MDEGLCILQAISTRIDRQRQLAPQNCLQMFSVVDTVDVLLEFGDFWCRADALAEVLVWYL